MNERARDVGPSATEKSNLTIDAISIGFGLLPLVAPRGMQQMSHALQPLLESGILLAR